jgi:hypothetical protein
MSIRERNPKRKCAQDGRLEFNKVSSPLLLSSPLLSNSIEASSPKLYKVPKLLSNQPYKSSTRALFVAGIFARRKQALGFSPQKW